jgi:hypothetical protein
VGFFALVGVAVTSWAAGRGLDLVIGFSEGAAGQVERFDREPERPRAKPELTPEALHEAMLHLQVEIEKAAPRVEHAAPARRRPELHEEEIAAVPLFPRNPAIPPPWKRDRPAVAADPDVPCDKASGLPPWRKCPPKRARTADEEDDIPAAPVAKPGRVSTGKWE